MQTALVTGSSGRVGRALVNRLEARGWVIRRFDLDSGDDLRDEATVAAAAEGCDVILHAGAIAHDSAGSPADIVATNVLGTWHVLLAGEHHGVSRVVYFSSAQVFGFAEGEGTPTYVPVDDGHPVEAARPYGMSKRLAEEMCAAWTARTGIPTVVLRPVMILDGDSDARIREDEAGLRGFVHVEDVVDAAILALDVELDGHHRMTLCGPGDFDTSVAERVLGWTPQWGQRRSS